VKFAWKATAANYGPDGVPGCILWEHPHAGSILDDGEYAAAITPDLVMCSHETPEEAVAWLVEQQSAKETR
tara:strand:+ start:20663 stop:20875 length:213 start_codon:yes stop_codon:yes gene_type:complete